MEDDIISKPEKQSQLTPAIALLGLGLGIVALALGIISMVKVGDTAADMNDKIEKAAALSLETKKISDRIDSLALQIETIKEDEKTKSNNLITQIAAELRKLSTAIENTRSIAVENRSAIEEVAKRATAPRRQQAEQKPQAAAEATAQQAEQPAQSATASSAPDGKKYKIQSGDTFAKLAKKFGVSVDAIISANPDANPSRLKVGQEITLP